MDDRGACKLSDVVSSSRCERHQMTDNQEGSSSFLNLAAILPLRPLFTKAPSLAVKTISCRRWCSSWVLKALLIAFTISASGKKKYVVQFMFTIRVGF